MKKVLLLLLTVFMCGFVTAPLSAQNVQLVEILGDGGTSTNQYLPAYTLYNNTLSEQIYTPDEIGLAGVISSIAFYNDGSEKTPNIKIYLVNTDQTEFSSTTSWFTVTESDLVFSGDVTFTPGQWTTIELTNTFVYDGVSNLGVVVDEYMQWSNGLACRVLNSTSNCAMYVYNDGTDYNAVGATYPASGRLSVKNQIQLGITPGTVACYPVTGLSVSDVSSTGAVLTWTGSEGATSYLIQYKTPSQSWDGAGVNTITATDTFYELLGVLTPITTYNVRVASLCGTGDTSVWRSVTFTSGCDVVTITDSWFEDFENYSGSGQQPFQCWATPVNPNGPFVYCGHSPSCHSGSNSAELKGASNVLVLPEFSNDLTTLRLTFWATADPHPGTGSLEIGVLTDVDDMNTFEFVANAGTPGPRGPSGSYGNGSLMGPFDFNNVTVTSGRIALRYSNASSPSASWNLDDFTVTFIPLCAEPSGLATGNVGAFSADVSWNETDGATYELLYWSDALDTTILSNAFLTDGVYTITNLSPNTQYHWTVRTDCGDGTYANAYYVKDFLTPNVPVELPYEQDFETNPELITDFTIQGSGPNQWAIGSATFKPADPTDDTETGHSLYVSNDNGASYHASTSTPNSFAYAVLDVEFPDNPMEYHLTFDYKAPHTPGQSYYSDYTYTRVYLMDGAATVPTSGAPSGTQIFNTYGSTPDWTSVDITLDNSVIGSSKKIVFYWYNYGSSWTSYFNGDPAAIDNIAIVGSECGTPTNLSVSGLTPNTATLNWVENGTSTAWTVYWKEAGSDDEYSEVTVLADPFVTLNTLDGNSTYEFYVVSNCDGGDSQPSTVYTFRTACDAISVSETPWTSNFEGTDEDFLNCWISASTGSRNGYTYPHIEPTSSIAHNSNAALEVAFGDIVTALPAFVEDLSALEFSFWAKTNNYSSVYNNILEVGYITDPTVASTFVALDTLPKTMTDYSRVVVSFEELADLSLPATTRIAFRFNQENTNNLTSWYLDDMSVNLIPTCNAPVYNSVTVSNITDATAEVSFTDNDESHSAWVIYYRPVNSTDDYLTENVSNTENNLLVGLNPNTTYTVFVKTVCGGAEGENQTEPTTFTTTTVPAEIPYMDDFEDADNMMWILLNGNQTNKWYVGTPTDSASDVNNTVDGSRGLYISNDNGASNNYVYAASRVYAYRDVMVPAGTTELKLSFDWKANGSNQGNEFLRVYWFDPEVVTLTAGNNPPSVGGVNYDAAGQPGNYGAGATEHWLALSTTWQHEEMIISANQFAGMGDEDKVYRLVFHWRNAFIYTATNPPAAVDNVALQVVECNAPTNIEVSNIAENSATVSWSGDANSYLLTVTQGVNSTTQEVVGNTYDMVGLNSSTNTVVALRALCDNDTSVVVTTSFTTSCGVITVTEANPWFEDFDGYLGNGEQPFVCWETPVTDASFHGPFVYCGHAPACHSGSNSAELKGANNMLVLPAFSNEIHDLRLSFWATATAPAIGTLEVGVVTDVNDPNSFELVATCGTPGERGSSGSGFGNFMGPFDFNGVQATGDSLRIALRYTSTSASQSWNLDDFTVQIAPGCPSPVKTSLTFTDIDAHSATVNFIDNDTDHNSWTVYYREAAADEGDPWMTETTSTTSATLTGLDAETTYDVYVITNCIVPDVIADATNTFQVTTTVACLPPTDLTVVAAINEAVVSWVGNADSYTVICGENTYTTTDNAYTLTGLNSGTAYTVSVMSDCGADGTSVSVTANFTTQCETVTAFPYIESFENGLGCWTSTAISGSSNWAQAISYNSDYNMPDGTYCALVSSSSPGYQTEFTSPVFDLTSLTNPYLSFYHIQAEWYGDQDFLFIYYRTSPFAEYQMLTSFTGDISTWQLDSIALPNPTSEYQIIFKAALSYGHGVGLDKVMVYEGTGSGPVVTCNTPTNLTVTTVTENSAVVAWTAGGSENAWNLQYKTAVSSDWGTTIPCTQPTYTFANLAANTQYEFRVQADCGGDQSVWSAALSFTTSGSTPVVTDPTVATDAATFVGQTTATLNGTITNPDNVTITAKGFQWKATTGGTYTTVNATGAGLTYNLTGLTPNTSYTYKAFITFNGQTVEGNEMTFTTQNEDVEPCETPTGLTTSNVTHESVTVAWDAQANVSSWNVQYRPTGVTTWNVQATSTNSCTINGLTPETTYEIQVQADCGNGTTSEWSSMVTATTTVGINHYLENSVSLYPNPAREYVDIRVDGDLNVTAMEVFDVYGKVVRTVEALRATSLQTERINVSGLANGMYFVRVTTEQGVVTKRFVKQ